MNIISISELKVNPSKFIEKAADTPVAVQNRNKIKAYLIGSELFEKIVSHLEDQVDTNSAKETDFSKGKDFEKVAKELGI